MSVIKRARDVALRSAERVGLSALQSIAPAGLARDATSALLRGAVEGVPLSRAGLRGMVVAEATSRIAPAIREAEAAATRALRRQAAGIDAGVAPSAAARIGASTRPAAPQQVPSNWAQPPLFGGLTLARYRQLFIDTAQVPKSWKSLFLLQITELQPTAESPSGPAPLNLLAIDVSFGPCTMQGDVVAIGGANIDHLSTTDRVEMRVTTLDDARGSVKRWFEAKCDQVAHSDGTFGLPAEYLMRVTVTHMAITPEAVKPDHLQHKYLMRPASVDIELSRRAPELEELTLVMVQFDTCVEA